MRSSVDAHLSAFLQQLGDEAVDAVGVAGARSRSVAGEVGRQLAGERHQAGGGVEAALLAPVGDVGRRPGRSGPGRRRPSSARRSSCRAACRGRTSSCSWASPSCGERGDCGAPVAQSADGPESDRLQGRRAARRHRSRPSTPTTSLTLARHPSETDERMMVRLLAFALNVPADDHDGTLEFAKGMWEPDEPELWQKDLTGRLVHWIEVGQPEERRLVKASGRADRVSVYAFSHGAPAWWAGLVGRVAPRRQRRRLAGAVRAEPRARPARRSAACSCRSTARTASSGSPTATARSRSHPRRLSAEPR